MSSFTAHGWETTNLNAQRSRRTADAYSIGFVAWGSNPPSTRTGLRR
jgi:hypothetical protein